MHAAGTMIWLGLCSVPDHFPRVRSLQRGGWSQRSHFLDFGHTFPARSPRKFVPTCVPLSFLEADQALWECNAQGGWGLSECVCPSIPRREKASASSCSRWKTSIQSSRSRTWSPSSSAPGTWVGPASSQVTSPGAPLPAFPPRMGGATSDSHPQPLGTAFSGEPHPFPEK